MTATNNRRRPRQPSRAAVSLRLPLSLLEAIDAKSIEEHSTRHAYLIQLLKLGLQTPEEMAQELSAWRDAAGMLEARLNEIAPEKAASIRQVYDCLEWDVEEVSDAKESGTAG